MIFQIAKSEDASFLPDIERSSGEIFRSLADLAWIADDDVQSVERHLQLIAAGWAWVARIDGRIVGFLNAEQSCDTLHLWQMAVHADYQHRGIGRQLVELAKGAARECGMAELTLTTFRNLAWNEAFYRSCGFQTIPIAQLSARLRQIIDAEVKAGLPLDQRCAMRYPCI